MTDSRRSLSVRGYVLAFMGALALTMLPGLTTCHTSDCPALDVDGNPLTAPCIQCSVPASVPCMGSVWYLAEGATCLEAQRPAHEDGTACGSGVGVCMAGVCEVDGFPCTEQGIRDAIAAGGGPHTFACVGPTTVSTTAEISINNDVILDGRGLLTVDGQNDHRVFKVLHSGITAELRGMTITRGGGDADYGAGIYNAGALTLTDVVVTDCTGTAHGGALYQHGPSMDLTRVTLTGNTAYAGGAIGGGQGPTTITDSVLSSNTATSLGGAIYVGGITTMNGTTLSDNETLFGGAIIVIHQGELAVYDSAISGNRAQSGGGIYTHGTVTIDNSVVSDNEVTIGGGGIRQDEGMVVISNSTISGNTAQFGAGIEAATVAPNTSLLTTLNTTVSGNAAVSTGGGVVAFGTSALAFVHTTVSGNTAGNEGSAGYGTDTVTITYKNSIIEGTCVAGSATGTIISYGYNIESPGNTCFLTHSTDSPGVALANLSLGPLQDNGGPTLTQAPESSGSVAVDLVPAAACTDHSGAPLVLDQRGLNRPENANCDAGAVEGYCENCDDGSECTTGVCDPVSRTCNYTQLPNWTPCPSGVGLCISGVCQLCARVTCPDDGNECTGTVCDPANGTCNVADGTTCASGAGQCMGGVCDLCVGVTCPDDGNECTDDVCDPATGDCSVPVEDGTACDAGNGQCVAGVCDHCAGVICPDDGNECTTDSCEPSTGTCVYDPLPDGTSCDSGYAECSAGACRGPEPLGLAWYRGTGWHPAVAMNPHGKGVAVWSECEDWCGFGGTERLVGRHYGVTDGWSLSFRIDNVDDSPALYPDVAMDRDGNAVAIWAQYFPGVGSVVNGSYYTAGVGWDPPVPISEPFPGSTGWERIYSPKVEMDGVGRAIAVWFEEEVDDQGMFVAEELLANTMNANGVWGTPAVIDNPSNNHLYHFDLAMDWHGSQRGTNGMVVWVEDSVVWARHYYGFSGWQDPMALGDAYPRDALQVVMDTSGDAIAVWRQSDTEIWTRRFNSTSWADPELLVSADLADPNFYIDLATTPFRDPFSQEEEAIVVWTEDDNPSPTEWTTTNLWTKRYTPSGPSAGWGPAELLETHDGKVFYPKVAMDPVGNAVAAWSRCPADPVDTGYYSCGDNHELWINRYRRTPYPNLGPDGWTTAELIEFLPEQIQWTSPQLAMDSYRDGLILWDSEYSEWDQPFAQSNRWTSAPAPTLSNGRSTHVPSTVWCLPNNYFRLRADYWDPDGDIKSSPEEDAVRIFVELRFSNNTYGNPQVYESERTYNQLSGNGFSGTVTANNCLYFGSADWVDVSLTIWDAAKNDSLNKVTMRVDKPAGAN